MINDTNEHVQPFTLPHIILSSGLGHVSCPPENGEHGSLHIQPNNINLYLVQYLCQKGKWCTCMHKLSERMQKHARSLPWLLATGKVSRPLKDRKENRLGFREALHAACGIKADVFLVVSSDLISYWSGWPAEWHHIDLLCLLFLPIFAPLQTIPKHDA